MSQAFPDEQLTEADLAACLWDASAATLVVGTADDAGVAAAVVRDLAGGRFAAVQLIAVAPYARRRGHARALLQRLKEWSFEQQGATALAAGGGVPYYLWPGVDVRATPALCLFEQFGFEPGTAALNMTYPASYRAPVPAGLSLRTAHTDQDIRAGLAFVDRFWPNWVAEAKRAAERGVLLIAWDTDGTVVGFCCHSVNRKGWLGPMGTHPGQRQLGLGRALLGAVAADVEGAGLETIEVSWLGPVGFYAASAGATVSRAFQTLLLTAPDSA